MKALAQELGAEIWLEACPGEKERRLPGALAAGARRLQRDPRARARRRRVALRAIKDHANPDLSALHVSLDPRTLLLIRS